MGCFTLRLILSFLSIFPIIEALGDIISDTNNNCQIIIDGPLDSQLVFQESSVIIGQELGKVSGKNVFHSFLKFDIGAGQKVTFTGDAALENVISRVTGGSSSTINGKIISQIPNMYFINPAGFMFGPNAIINIPGSFHVSSADKLHFGDHKSFFSEPLESKALSTEAPTSYIFSDQRRGFLST